MSWRSLSLRSRLVRAIRKADIPVLFIQAENDYDLGPSRTLAHELNQLGKPHKHLSFHPMEVPKQKDMDCSALKSRTSGDPRFLPFSTLQWRSEKSPLNELSSLHCLGSV